MKVFLGVLLLLAIAVYSDAKRCRDLVNNCKGTHSNELLQARCKTDAMVKKFCQKSCGLCSSDDLEKMIDDVLSEDSTADKKEADATIDAKKAIQQVANNDDSQKDSELGSAGKHAIKLIADAAGTLVVADAEPIAEFKRSCRDIANNCKPNFVSRCNKDKVVQKYCRFSCGLCNSGDAEKVASNDDLSDDKQAVELIDGGDAGAFALANDDVKATDAPKKTVKGLTVGVYQTDDCNNKCAPCFQYCMACVPCIGSQDPECAKCSGCTKCEGCLKCFDYSQSKVHWNM